jgi:hypothetical protein
LFIVYSKRPKKSDIKRLKEIRRISRKTEKYNIVLYILSNYLRGDIRGITIKYYESILPFKVIPTGRGNKELLKLLNTYFVVGLTIIRYSNLPLRVIFEYSF